MTKKQAIGSLFALGLPALLGVAMFAYLGSMSRFLADDYCVAYYARHFGLLRSMWYWYITWSGGFSTSIIDWLLIFIKPTGIPYVVPVVLVIWLAVETIAVALLLPRDTPTEQKLIAALALGPMLVFMILLLSPDVPQSLYWWTGMRAYILPLLVSMLWVIAYQEFRRGDRRGNVLLWCLLSFGITFLNGGFSETFTPVQVVFFALFLGGGLWLRSLRFREPSFYFWAAGLFGALASLIVMVAAPGNANRQAFFPHPPGLFSLLQISLAAYGNFLVEILRTPEKVAGLLGAILGTFWLAGKLDAGYPADYRAPLAAFAGAFVFSFGCFIPAAWGLSDAPPDRNLSIPVFFLVTGLMAAAFLSGNLLTEMPNARAAAVLRIASFLAAFGLLAFSVYVNNQNLYATRDAYVRYARKWDRVNLQIITARQSGAAVAHIPPMDSWTSLDIPNDNPRYWLTECYTQYYGIQVLSP